MKTSSQPVEVTYAATDIPYAGIAAQEDAQQRAADQAADRIRTDLGIYFRPWRGTRAAGAACR